MEITLCIRGQKLEAHYPPLYSGSIGVLYARFAEVDFDKTLIKTVRFKTADSDWYTSNIIDGAALVPYEVIIDGGFDVALAGYDSEDGELTRFLPTNSVHIDVTENGFGDPDAPLKTESKFESVIAKLDKMAVKGALSSGDNVLADLPSGVYHLSAGVTNAPVDWGGTLIVSRSEPDENNMVYSDRIYIVGDAEYNATKEDFGFIYQATLYGAAGSELGVDTPWYDVTRKSEINAELEKKAELSFVKKLIPKTTVEGETLEITDHLEGVAAINYKIYGNSKQETRSGKNLLPFTEKQFTTSAGLIFTCIGGELFVDGTSSETILSINEAFKTNFSFTIPAGTYVFSRPETSAVPAVAIRSLANDDVIASLSGYSIKTFTLDEAAEVYLGLYILTGDSFSNILVPLQLEVGSAATEYQPTGASPSPDYPSEINNVGNRNGKDVYSIRLQNEDNTLIEVHCKEPIRGCGQYMDSMRFDSQRIERNICHLRLISDLSWNISDDAIYTELLPEQYIKTDGESAPLASNYAPAESGWISANTEGTTINFDVSSGNWPFTTVEELCEWLDTHEIYVEYPLATPIYEEIDMPELIMPESDTVHVNTATEVPGTIELTYYQDINKKMAELQAAVNAI